MPREILVTKSIRFSPSMIKRLEKLADNEGMNFSECVRLQLETQCPAPVKRRRRARSN